MVAIILLIILAVNGGLFTGTILYSAYRSAQFGRSLDLMQNFGLDSWF